MHLQLLVYVNDEQVDALGAIAAGAAFDPESCGLGLEIGGVEYLRGRWNLGRIDLVTAQLEDCARRLAAGQPGIVRSGVLGWTGVPFHLFEPPASPGDPALVSRFFIEDDPDREAWFPLAGWGHPDPEELFAWVAAHRATLLTPDAALRREVLPMVRVPVPVGALIEALHATAAAGRRVLAATRDAPVAAD